MKHLFFSIITLLSMTLCVACSDDNGQAVDYRSSIKIIQSNATFDGSASTGGVRFDAPQAISATTTASWCHVNVINKDSISISVDENPSIEGRTTEIIVTAGTDQTSVIAQQKGMSFLPNIIDSLALTSDASVAKYYVKHTTTVKAWSNVDWVKTSLTGDSLVVTTTANNTNNFRQGKVFIQSGPYTQSMIVSQAYDFDKTYLGKYWINYYYNNKWDDLTANFVKTEKGEYKLVINAPKTLIHGLSIPIEVDHYTNTIAISNLGYMGPITYKEKQHHAIIMVVGGKKGTTLISRFANAGIKVIGKANNRNGGLFWDFTVNEVFNSKDYTLDRLNIGLTTNGTYNGFESYFWDMPQFNLEKQP